MENNICILPNCNNKIYPEVETDISVGIQTYWGNRICQQCYEIKPDEVAARIKQEKEGLPF